MWCGVARCVLCVVGWACMYQPGLVANNCCSVFFVVNLKTTGKIDFPRRRSTVIPSTASALLISTTQAESGAYTIPLNTAFCPLRFPSEPSSCAVVPVSSAEFSKSRTSCVPMVLMARGPAGTVVVVALLSGR